MEKRKLFYCSWPLVTLRKNVPSIICPLHDEALHLPHYLVATQYTILIMLHQAISSSSLELENLYAQST